jgi:tetratricopeptide (TPR) repeat protein
MAWRYDRLNRFRAIRSFCEEYIPSASTVLIDQGNGVTLTMACDCHIVASYSASNGVQDLGERRKDLSRMLDRRTKWSRRRELLDRYEITHVLAYGHSVRWTRGRVKAYWRGQDSVFVELAEDLDRTTPLPPRGPDSAFRIGARNLGVRQRIGNALAELGDREAALTEFEHTAQKYGKSAKGQYGLANALSKAGDLRAAVRAYRKAMKLKPKAANIHYGLASTLIKLGRTSEAVDQYRETLRFKPDHARARQELAAALEALDDPGTH